MIYIIEDDVSVSRSFEMFLKSAGLEFKSFRNAESFLTIGKPGQNDLLLIDINLPGMTGLDMLGKLEQQKKNIPAIVITSQDDPKTLESCRKYGVKAFMRKPVDGDALMDLIRYYLQS
jgi:FixJ family two-component response regulator